MMSIHLWILHISGYICGWPFVWCCRNRWSKELWCSITTQSGLTTECQNTRCLFSSLWRSLSWPTPLMLGPLSYIAGKSVLAYPADAGPIVLHCRQVCLGQPRWCWAHCLTLQVSLSWPTPLMLGPLSYIVGKSVLANPADAGPIVLHCR